MKQTFVFLIISICLAQFVTGNRIEVVVRLPSRARCLANRIKADARCGCYILSENSLSNNKILIRCQDVTRSKLWQMKQSCDRYIIRSELRPKVYLRNLRYIVATCPKEIRFKDSARYFSLMKDILSIQQAGPSVAPIRELVVAEGEVLRVARLADYNNFNILRDGTILKRDKKNGAVQKVKTLGAVKEVKPLEMTGKGISLTDASAVKELNLANVEKEIEKIENIGKVQRRDRIVQVDITGKRKEPLKKGN